MYYHEFRCNLIKTWPLRFIFHIFLPTAHFEQVLVYFIKEENNPVSLGTSLIDITT